MNSTKNDKLKKYIVIIKMDEKSLIKQAKLLAIRIIGGIFIFFIPTIVKTIFEMVVDITENDQYKTCVSCVLDPTNETECNTKDSDSESTSDINNSTNKNSSTDQNSLTNSTSECQDGYVYGKDGLCHKKGTCGSYPNEATCIYYDCTWSAVNGCTSK